MELSTVKYIERNQEKIESGVHGKIRRVALDQYGNLVKVHDAKDTDKWEDGSEVDWEKYEADGWNCMVQIPKFYYRVEQGTYNRIPNVKRWSVSSTPLEGYNLHQAFDTPNGKCNSRYIGAFEGWVDATHRLRSLPGKPPTVSMSLEVARAAALANYSPNWAISDLTLYSMIPLLFYTEYGKLVAKNILGNTTSARMMSGLSKKLGNRSSDGGTYSFVSYRGIENIYGSTTEFVDGVIYNAYKTMVCQDFKKYEEKVNEHYVDFGKINSAQIIKDVKFFEEEEKRFAFLAEESASGTSGNMYFGGRGYHTSSNIFYSMAWGYVEGKSNYNDILSYGNVTFAGNSNNSARLQFMEFINEESGE